MAQTNEKAFESCSDGFDRCGDWRPHSPHLARRNTGSCGTQGLLLDRPADVGMALRDQASLAALN